MKKLLLFFFLFLFFTVPPLFLLKNQYRATIADAWHSVQHTYYKAAASFSEHPDDLANLGFFYLSQDKYDLAERYLLPAAQKGHKYASRLLGGLYLENKKWYLAEKYLVAGLESSVTPQYHKLLASLYVAFSQLAEAKPHIIEAIKCEDAQAYILLGCYYGAKNKLQLAEEWLFKAFEKKADLDKSAVDELYYRLGLLKFSQNQLTEAQEWLELSEAEHAKVLLLELEEKLAQQEGQQFVEEPIEVEDGAELPAEQIEDLEEDFESLDQGPNPYLNGLRELRL